MTKAKIGSMVVIALLLVTGVTAMGSAMAQQTTEAGNTTTTATPEPTETSTPSNETSVIQIDSSATVLDYEFQGDKLVIWIESDYSQLMVISDMFVAGTGAQNIPQKRMTLDSGRNRITFETTTWKGTHGATIATSDGAIAISEKTGGTSFSSKYSAETLIGMGIVGILSGVGLVLGIAYKRELDYTSDVKREL